MKKVLNGFISAAALSLCAAFFSPAFAQSAGSNVIEVGWAHLSPNSSADTLTSTSPPFAGIQVFTSGSDTGMNVSHADTLNFAITHFWTDNFATTLDAGIPSRLQFSGSGVDFVGTRFVDIGSANQWNPMIVAKWFFGDAKSKFRPFIGAGVTYVEYSNTDLTQAYQDAVALSSVAGRGRATAHLSSSWAPVANIGATYHFYKNWSLGLSISYIPLKTNVDISATGGDFGPQTSRSTITMNPLVTFLSLGYTF
jgi:outer membrane protein